MSKYRIDQRLKELGKSREWLAAQMDITTHTLGLYIRGQQVPLSYRIRELCTYLGCDENFIFFGHTGTTLQQGGGTRPI